VLGEPAQRRFPKPMRFDPDEWDLPPKPKWMRWRTYNRMVETFDRYEAMVEEGLLEAVKQLG
jgi:hypothetical protein